MLAFGQILCARPFHGATFHRTRIDGYDDGYGERRRISMGRKAREIGPLAVSRLGSPGLHFVGGVAGLVRQVNQRGARSWVLRVQVGDKRRNMGPGGFPDISLAGAREAARHARAKVRDGIDTVANSRRCSAGPPQRPAPRGPQCTRVRVAPWRHVVGHEPDRGAAPDDERPGRLLRKSRNQDGQRDLDERCTPPMVSFGVPL